MSPLQPSRAPQGPPSAPSPSDDPLTAVVAAGTTAVLFVLLSFVGAHQRAELVGEVSPVLQGIRWAVVACLPLVPLGGGLILGRLTRGGPLVPGLVAGALGSFAAAATAGALVAAVTASHDYLQLLLDQGHGLYEEDGARLLSESLVLALRYALGGLWFATVVGAAMGGMGAWIAGSRRPWGSAPADPLLRGLVGSTTLGVLGGAAPGLVWGLSWLSASFPRWVTLPEAQVTTLLLLSLGACTLAAQGLAWSASRTLWGREQHLVPVLVLLGALVSALGWGAAAFLTTSLPARALAGVVAASSLVGLWGFRPLSEEPLPKLRTRGFTAVGVAAVAGLPLSVAISLPLGVGLLFVRVYRAGLPAISLGIPQAPSWLYPVMVELWQLQGGLSLGLWALGAGTAGALAAAVAAVHTWRLQRSRAVRLGLMAASLLLLPVLAGRTLQILFARESAAPPPPTLLAVPAPPEAERALERLGRALLDARPEEALDTPPAPGEPLESVAVRAMLDELEGVDASARWEEAVLLAKERTDPHAQALRSWPEDQVLFALLERRPEDLFLRALLASMARQGRAVDPDAALHSLARLTPKAAWPALLLMERAEERGALDAVDATVEQVQGWRGEPVPVLIAEQARAHLRLGDDPGALALIREAPESAWDSPDFAGAAVAAGMAGGDQDLVVRGWKGVQEGPPSARGARAAVEGCVSVGQVASARALIAVLGARERPLPAPTLHDLEQLVEAPLGRGEPRADACLALAQQRHWAEVVAEDSPCTHYGAHRAARAVAHYSLSRRGRWSERQAHKQAYEALWAAPDEGLLR